MRESAYVFKQCCSPLCPFIQTQSSCCSQNFARAQSPGVFLKHTCTNATFAFPAQMQLLGEGLQPTRLPGLFREGLSLQLLKLQEPCSFIHSPLKPRGMIDFCIAPYIVNSTQLKKRTTRAQILQV